MQINLIQCHCPTPANFLHGLTAFKSTHTVKRDPKVQITFMTESMIKVFMTKHFFTFKQFYLRAFWCVQSIVSIIVAILKNNSAIY